MGCSIKWKHEASVVCAAALPRTSAVSGLRCSKKVSERAYSIGQKAVDQTGASSTL